MKNVEMMYIVQPEVARDSHSTHLLSSLLKKNNLNSI